MLINEAVTRLQRVLKKIKGPDGTTHQRAYYVKQAEPGDVYAQNKSLNPGKRFPQVKTDVPDEQDDAVLNYNPDELEEKYSHRIVVEPLIMPWLLSNEADGSVADPIPAELRKRFDPENRATRHRSPVDINIPLFTIKPGEDLLWGAQDSDLLNRLRNGMIVGVRPSQADGHPTLVKVESPDGTIERAYVNFEGMINERILDLYGDMYDLRDNSGALSRRAAAAYEVAKASGFDDLVPPTVYRVNEHDGLEPMLSTDAIESFASAINVQKDGIPAMIGNSASLQLWVEDSVCLCEHPEFMAIINDISSVNNFYSNIPWIKSGLIRGAVYDFLVWNGSRTWMDITVCPNVRHPVHLMRNNLVLPNPIAQGTAFLDYQSDYSSGCPNNAQYMPMLWSDLVIMATLRGYDEEANIYDDIAWECSKRMQGERIIDLIRSLNDHQIGALAISGLLVRTSFLRYGARQVMRNPLLVPQYFSSLLTGDSFDPGFDIDLDQMVESIDKAMQQAIRFDFSFIAEMTGSNEDE